MDISKNNLPKNIRLLTIEDVAGMLRVSTKTIRRRIGEGSFCRVVKEGRKYLFIQSDIEAYIVEHTF